MFANVLIGLFAAWILSLFGFDVFLLKAVEELTGESYSVAVYYFAVVILAVVGSLVEKLTAGNK